MNGKDIMSSYELLNKHHVVGYEVSDVDGMCTCDLYDALEEIINKDGKDVTPQVEESVKYYLRRIKEDALEDSWETYCEHMKDAL